MQCTYILTEKRNSLIGSRAPMQDHRCPGGSKRPVTELLLLNTSILERVTLPCTVDVPRLMRCKQKWHVSFPQLLLHPIRGLPFLLFLTHETGTVLVQG